MPEYTELQQKFHLISGCYIAGTIFSEYANLLKFELNHKIKGETTLYNRVVEAEAKAKKSNVLLQEKLESIGCEISVTRQEIDNLEALLYNVLTLDETDQKRVVGLIDKIKRENELKAYKQTA